MDRFPTLDRRSGSVETGVSSGHSSSGDIYVSNWNIYFEKVHKSQSLAEIVYFHRKNFPPADVLFCSRAVADIQLNLFYRRHCKRRRGAHAILFLFSSFSSSSSPIRICNMLQEDFSDDRPPMTGRLTPIGGASSDTEFGRRYVSLVASLQLSTIVFFRSA